MEKKEITFEDLVGNHALSGVDYGSETVSDGWGDGGTETAECVVFCLDGVNYIAMEDPEDGYRSMCQDIQITDRKIINIFPPIDVMCIMKGDTDRYEKNDILEVYENGNLILSIGTGNYGDYYPYFYFEYNPEAISFNSKGI